MNLAKRYGDTHDPLAVAFGLAIGAVQQFVFDRSAIAHRRAASARESLDDFGPRSVIFEVDCGLIRIADDRAVACDDRNAYTKFLTEAAGYRVEGSGLVLPGQEAGDNPGFLFHHFVER